MMPNKTIYVADADMALFEKAQALAGGNLSAAISTALRRYIAEKEPDGDEVIITVREEGISWKKRFRGRLIAQQKVSGDHEEKSVHYKIYRTEKDHFAVWSNAMPNWSSWHRRQWQQWEKPETWDEEWWRGDSRLDVFDTLDDLRGNIPDRLFARVARIIDTGSEIEDLDI